MRNVLMALALACVLSIAIAPAFAQDADPIAVLKSDAPFLEKSEACRILSVSGGQEAIPALAALLCDEKLSHMARYALEPMPFPEAGEALFEAIAKTSGRLKIGMMHSLTRRGDEKVVPELVKVLGADDLVSEAAAICLGKLGTPEAVQGLEDALAQKDITPRNLKAVCDGLLGSAEKLCAKGEDAQAATVYDVVLGLSNAPKQIQTAALRGAILARGAKKGLPLLAEALRSEDSHRFSVALRAARELQGGPEAAAALAAALPEQSDARKISLLQTLGQIADAAVGPVVLAEAQEGPAKVRVAALRALARVGYVPALELMAHLAWNADGALAMAAQNTLSHFPGVEGDAALKTLLANEDPKARRVAISLVGQGGLPEPVGVLMSAAKTDKDEDVRVTALKSLTDRAGMGEMPDLLALLTGAHSEDEARAAENALASLCNRQKSTAAGHVEAEDAGTLALATAPVPPAIVDAFCAALEGAQGGTKLALLRLLGATGSHKAYETVHAAAFQGEGKVKDTGLRVLCEWPTDEALSTVMDLALNSSDETVRVLAMRGAVRLLKSGGAGTDELLKQYATLMAQASSAGEKKLVLSGLAQVNHVDSFEMVLNQFGDESVKAEAVQAAMTIAQEFGKSAKEDPGIFNGKDLSGWQGSDKYWRLKDGAIVGRSKKKIPESNFIWSDIEVRDFYLAIDVKLDPPKANAGIQFRSKKMNEQGKALGYQADMGKDVWGRLYHEQGRGKLDWRDRAEKAVKPGEWNRYEILAIGPAIWTAVNGRLGVAFFETGGEGERSGHIAFQIHVGPAQTARYRIEKLIHNPEVKLGKLGAKELIGQLEISTRKETE